MAFRRLAQSRIAVAALVLASASQMGSGCQPAQMNPWAGMPEYTERLFVPVPGALVNVSGGNLWVRRTDLSLDTRLGPYDLGATYNSQAGVPWIWDFQITYDGTYFYDATGGWNGIGANPLGSAVPGSTWIRVSTTELRTKGGLIYTFGAGGRLNTIRRADGLYPQLRFEESPIGGASRIDKIKQCTASQDCEVFFTIGYDTVGKVISITDRANREVTFTYDGIGRIATAKSPTDVDGGHPGIRYEYSLATNAGRLSAQVSSSGVRYEYVYTDARTTTARAVGATNPQFTFLYRPRGTDGYFDTEVTRPSGARSIHKHDDNHQLLSVEDAQTGDRHSWTWVDRRPKLETTPSGEVTDYTYTNDNVTRIQEPSGNVTLITYNLGAVNRNNPNAAPVATVTDSVGKVLTVTYDGVGRAATVKNGKDEETTISYGTLNQITQVLGPSGKAWNYSNYGSHGHPKLIERGPVSSELRYDTVGNLLEGPGDPNDLSSPLLGGNESRAFDKNRRLIKLTLANQDTNGSSTSKLNLLIERREDGLMTAIRRPYGGDWEFVYDALGRETIRRERVNSVWQSRTTGYDAAGRPSSVTEANGMRREVQYDTSDRLSVLRLLEDGALWAEETRTYLEGRIDTISDTRWGGAETYSYDTAGRVSAIVFPYGERKEFSYDHRSRSTGQVYKSAASSTIANIGYEYDLADRLTVMKQSGVALATHTYTDGELTSSEYANGVTRSYAYHPSLGYVTSAESVNELNQTIEDTTVDYVLGGWGFEVNAETNTSGGPVSATKKEKYLIGPIWLGSTASPGPRVWTWSENASSLETHKFDELSNLRALGQARSVQFNYNTERNRLQTTSGDMVHSYTYDESGYVTDRDGQAIDWDAGGRLYFAYGVGFFVWDARGRAVSRLDAAGAWEFAFGGEMRVTASTRLPVSLSIGEVEVRFDLNQRFYRHTDFRGNVKFVTNDAGLVVAHYQYDAFGLRWAGGSTVAEGQFAQGNAYSSVVILGTRAYDPAVGQFLSPDPIPQLVNQYSYALGNPVFMWDPSGFQAAVIEPGIGNGGMGNAGAVYVGQQLVEVGHWVSGAGAVLVLLPFSEDTGIAAGGYLTAVVGFGITALGNHIQTVYGNPSLNHTPRYGPLDGPRPSINIPGGPGGPNGGSITGPKGTIEIRAEPLTSPGACYMPIISPIFVASPVGSVVMPSPVLLLYGLAPLALFVAARIGIEHRRARRRRVEA